MAGGLVAGVAVIFEGEVLPCSGPSSSVEQMRGLDDVD
jgi:hypothetical protein